MSAFRTRDYRNRLQDLAKRYTLSYSELAESFTNRNKHFHPNLALLAKGVDTDSEFIVNVSFWEDVGTDRVIRKRLAVKKPPFPWYYDLRLKQNFEILHRFHSRKTVSTLAEVNWVALNIARFHSIGTWSFFYAARRTLWHWASAVADLVSRDYKASECPYGLDQLLVGNFVYLYKFCSIQSRSHLVKKL